MNNNKVIAITLLILICVSYSFAADWSGSFQFRVSAFRIRSVERDGNNWSLLTPDNNAVQPHSGLYVDYLNEPGKPILPYWFFTLVIPQGMKIGEVKVTTEGTTVIKAENPPYPGQPPVPVSRRELPPFVQPDQQVYSGTNPWPEKGYAVSSVGNKAGFRLVTITIYPVRYDPQSKSYLINRQMQVEVNYQPDPSAEAAALFPNQLKVFSRAVKALVANPADVERYAPVEKLTDFGTYDYVIITNQTLEADFQSVLNWRNRLGYTGIIRNTSWINSNYTGRDLQEKIRNFIRDYFNNQGTIWVLLGGDTAVVPTRRARSYCAGYTGDIPCDLYYADLQWSWDADNDNIFGEYGQDTTDLYYDVYVGRVTANTAGHVNTFFNKVKTHESNPPTDYLKRILLVEAQLWPGYDDKQSNDSIENITPSGWSDVRIHYPGNSTMVRDSLNNGFQFSHMVGHGDDYGIYHSGPFYHTSVISGHNNGSRVCLINSIACYPGNFEMNDCLAESTHNWSNGGALAVIMNSRYGWGTPPYLGPSEKLDIRFYDFFFNNTDSMPIGLTHAESKEVYRNLAYNDDGAWRWCYFELNLFGDPLQLMYEDTPIPLNASFISPINVGSQNFTVTVSANSSPVEQALVCVWKGSEVYARNYTNSSGQVTFTINPTTPGYMYVTASKPNYLPDLDSCQVVFVQNDVGVSQIIQPTGTVDYLTVVTPQAIVRNYKSVPVANVPVKFTIAGGYSSTKTIPSINGNDSALVLFDQWTAQPPGNLAVKCSTMVAGDENQNNDFVNSSVFVRYRDVGTISISIPSEVDSGTIVYPVATVRNYGNVMETFNVRMVISGTSYDQTRTKTLMPGVIDTVNFPSWVALERGSHTVKCSTQLSADQDKNNDKATASVFVRVRDVGCSQIISPVGNVDSTASLQVKAKVKNYGNTNESFTVLFRITGPTMWSDVATVNNLPAGDSVVVNFNNWPCGPRGSYLTACSTSLTGDLKVSNDRTTGNFNLVVHDVAARTILSPGAQVDSGALVPVRVTIENLGSTVENAKVFVRIGSYYQDSSVVTISAGQLDTVDLAAWRVLAPRGNVIVRCSTFINNDIRRDNDTIRSVTTVVVHDLRTIAILAPTGVVDSGNIIAPQARVKNLGSVAEQFGCRFTISDGYIAQLSVTLDPGADSVLTFPDWTANIPGVFETKCSTLLANDGNPNNNRATGTVQVVGTDVGVVAIISPTSQVDPGLVAPVVKVGNFSTVAKSFMTYLKITPQAGGAPVYYDSSYVSDLPADSTREVVFADWEATRGRYVVRCSVGLGDPHPDNDTMRANCQVVTHDVGLVSLSPQGQMRPMVTSPVIRIKNFGDAAEMCQVFLVITDTVSGNEVYYESTEVNVISPGETKDVRMPSWPATIGYYWLNASVNVAKDVESGNDTLKVKLKVSPGALGWMRRPDLPSGGAPVKAGGALAGMETDSMRVFALKGNKTLDFYVYNAGTGVWRSLPSMPGGPSGRPVNKSGALCSDGERYIYAAKGNGTLEFWRYDVINRNWRQLADIPPGARSLKGGTGLAFVRRGDTAEVYCLKGSNTLEFYVYSVANNVWYPREQPPAGPAGKMFKAGSALCAYGNDRLFAVKSVTNEFYQYSIAENRWIPKAGVPDYSASGKRARCKDGCALAGDGIGTVYALTGGNRDFFFCYNVVTNNWFELAPMPTGSAGKKVKSGGALTYLRKQIWALRGNSTNEFYVYVPDTMGLFATPPARSGVAGGPIEKRNALEVKILPNPASNVLGVVNYGAKAATIDVYSPAGQLVISATLGANKEHWMDIGKLSAGVYLVRIRTGEESVVSKLIVQR